MEPYWILIHLFVITAPQANTLVEISVLCYEIEPFNQKSEDSVRGGGGALLTTEYFFFLLAKRVWTMLLLVTLKNPATPPLIRSYIAGREDEYLFLVNTEYPLNGRKRWFSFQAFHSLDKKYTNIIYNKENHHLHLLCIMYLSKLFFF